MRYLGSQRGESRAGCLLWVLVLLAGGLLAAKVVPVKIATHQLKDFIEDIAERHPRWKQNYALDKIYRRARELELPLKKKEIKIKKNSRQMKVDIIIKVPIDLYFTDFVWKEEIHVDREIFII